MSIQPLHDHALPRPHTRFHRPEELIRLVNLDSQVRARLREMPAAPALFRKSRRFAMVASRSEYRLQDRIGSWHEEQGGMAG